MAVLKACRMKLYKSGNDSVTGTQPNNRKRNQKMAIRNTVLPPEFIEEYGDIDSYESHDEFIEDIERAASSWRGQAYQPDTDDSALYDGGYDSTYGYEG